MKAMESKYKTQIKEIMETHSALSQDSKNKIKRLETELQTITEKMNSAAQNRFEEVGTLEKRFAESIQNEEKLNIELEELKNERNRRVSEYQSQIEKERESFKQRLYESEKKARDAESKRANLLFTVEKERANWVLEEDQLKRKVNELEESIQSLEQNKENLKKEVDRLRTDLRATGASSSGPARKPFLFAKPASSSPGLNATQNSAGASKYLLNKSGQLNSNISSSGSNAGGAYNSQGLTGGQKLAIQTTTANNIINAALNRLKETKMQKAAGTNSSNQQPSSDTFGPKSLALKQSTSQSSLGQGTAMRRDMMASPDTQFSMQSANPAGGTFGASRNSSSGGQGRVPFGQTSQLAYNVQSAATKALSSLGGAKSTTGLHQKSGSSAINAESTAVGTQGKQLIFGFGRANSRGASNGRDRYRNASNAENNFDATSQDNSQI